VAIFGIMPKQNLMGTSIFVISTLQIWNTTWLDIWLWFYSN